MGEKQPNVSSRAGQTLAQGLTCIWQNPSLPWLVLLLPEQCVPPCPHTGMIQLLWARGVTHFDMRATSSETLSGARKKNLQYMNLQTYIRNRWYEWMNSNQFLSTFWEKKCVQPPQPPEYPLEVRGAELPTWLWRIIDLSMGCMETCSGQPLAPRLGFVHSCSGQLHQWYMPQQALSPGFRKDATAQSTESSWSGVRRSTPEQEATAAPGNAFPVHFEHC